MMNCRNVEFSAEKSAQRVVRFQPAFDPKLLSRILALALYLLGSKGKEVASLLNLSEDSLKTMLRTVQRDGFNALRDRRHSMPTPNANAPTSVAPTKPAVTVQLDEQFCVIDFGEGKQLKIVRTHRIHLKTVLLSLYQSGLLTADDISSALKISTAHCRELSIKLAHEDVVDALVDKRQGQKQDYLVGKAEKAELIKHFAAETMIGRSTSGRALAKVIHEESQLTLSERTIRWHVNKLGLNLIKKTLLERVETVKKTSS